MQEKVLQLAEHRNQTTKSMDIWKYTILPYNILAEYRNFLCNDDFHNTNTLADT